VLKRFRSELDSGSIDIVHRLTPMSPVIPSPLACWTKTPFVLGPLNGGLRWPRAYTAELRKEREYLTHVRNLYRLMPYYRRSLRDAAAILASFDHTIAGLPASVRAKTVDFPEVGVDPAVFHYAPRPTGRRLTFVFAGRLVPYKCPDVAVAAFAESELLRAHRLVIVGDGPERAYLEEMISQHGLEGVVELTGLVPQPQVASILAEADVFVFPSIRELGAGVVVEAMASGCVPVVIDYGGPGGLVIEGTGVKVPLDEKSVLTANLRLALEELARFPERLPAMSANAHRHAIDNYSWDAKAQKTLEAYEWALGRRREPPTFGDSGHVNSNDSGKLR
jgi:glycosyltransferase involved in cell wall biosynthesis